MKAPGTVWVVGAGLVLGWLLPIVWEKVAPARSARLFWRSLAGLARAVVADVDGNDFLKIYGSLLNLLARYAGRNLLALAASIAPVVVFWGVFLTPGAPVAREEAPAYLEIHPPQEARLTVGQRTYDFSRERFRIPFDFVSGRSGRLESASGRFEIGALHRGTALCASTLRCLLFRSLNFKVIPHDPRPGGNAAYTVLRPSDGDDNSLWPFLSDAEFLFLLSLTAASLAGFFRRSKRA